MEYEIDMQEEKREGEERVEEDEEKIKADEKVVVDDDDDDDGPPPGFQCIVTPVLHLAKKDEVDEEEDEGPPPGFHYISLKPSPSPHSFDEEGIKQQDVEFDDDGPPPGWEFFSLANALPKRSSNSADANVESNVELNGCEDEGEGEGEVEGGGHDDEGPPPGWEEVLHHQMPLPCTPPSQPSQTVSSDSKQNNDEGPQLVSQSTPCRSPLPLLRQSSPQTPQQQQLPSSGSPAEAGSKGDTKDVDRTPISVPAATLKQSLPSASHPSAPNVVSSSSEKAQLVCGTCRKLLLYPLGAKWVQCPGCQEVNFVLEAHEVGQVNCGSCGVLLMYPHGAPAVQCTSCVFVTEIGANNRRPPLSVQMAQRRRRPIRDRAC